MKKKYLIWLLVFLMVVVLIPIILECLYRIGDNHALIASDFTQSDWLGYIASVFALIIALTALFYALSSDEPKFNFDYNVGIESNEAYIDITIVNCGNINRTISKIYFETNKNSVVDIFEGPITIVDAGCPFPHSGFKRITISELLGKEDINKLKTSQLKLHIKLTAGQHITLNCKEMVTEIKDVITNGTQRTV